MFPKPVFTDPDMAREFLNRMYGPNAVICFQVFGERRGTDIQPEWRYGTFDAQRNWLVQMNQAGAGIFFMCNLGDSQGRTAKNVTQVTYLFVDLDGAPHEPLLASGCTPHVITQSSPGRYQAFWKITDCPLDKFAAYQKALAAKFGGDPAVCDLPRVMRLPGFTHQKREPFKSEVFKYHDLQPWKPDLMVKLLGISLNGHAKTESIVSTPAILGAEKFPQGSRNRSMISVIGRMRNSGLTGEDLFNAAMRVNENKCDPPLGPDEIRRLVNWGNKKEERPIVPASVGLLNEMQHPDVQSLGDIYTQEIEPIHWVIDDILPAGLTVLAADPKSGKSYLAQHLGIAIASGTQAMGQFKVCQGDVLHLGLEDSVVRFKQRLHRLLGDSPPPNRAFFARKWGQLPDAAKQIRAWLKQAENPQLVVVDTFAKIRGRPRRWDTSGIYERDYQDVSLLQDLAQDFQVALLLVHHTNKGDNDDDFRRISGTQGLTGAADAMWLMQTDREVMEATLVMAGREVADKRLWLRMDKDTGIWGCAGSLADMKRRQSEVKIIEAMIEIGRPANQSEIGRYCGMTQQAVSKTFKMLLADGIIQKSVTGKFIVAPRLQSTVVATNGIQPRNFNNLENV